MKNIVKCAAIVVLFYPDSDTVKNIESYLDQFQEVYLIDNSDISNYGLLKKNLSSSVKYYPQMKNRGIAFALNLGFEKALESQIPYVITLDQDSRFETNILEEYSYYIINHDMREVLALSPQYKTDRNKIIRKYGYSIINLTMQSGCLFQTTIVNTIGNFDTNLFLDTVDWEYCMRGRNYGLKIIKCNSAILLHKPATTKEINLLGYKFKYGVASPVRYYYQIRNLLWLFRKYKSVYCILIMFIKWAKILLLFDNKEEYIQLAKLAIHDGYNSILGEYELG